MKITIVALCIIGAALAAQGTPAATSFCQGNNDNATTCSSCHNAGTNARYLANGTCITMVTNVITDCKYYNPSITTTKAATDCFECDNKNWLNVTETGPAITCSDTAAVAATCTATLTNCDQSVCYTNAASVTNMSCAKCDSGYTGSGTIANGGYPACTTTTIANCDIGAGTACSTCKSGYAVAAAGTSCVAFTTDSNCRAMGTGDTYCGSCDFGYIFNLLVCESSAKLMAFSGLIMALFFFN
jgi:hypothetical protein